MAGASSAVESIYGEAGSYRKLCGAGVGFLRSELRWLDAVKMHCEYVERWRSEWDWQRFRVNFRPERRSIAKMAAQVLLSGRITAQFYE